MSLEILPLQPEFAWLKQNFDGVGLDAMFFFEFEQRQPDLPTIFDFHERLKKLRDRNVGAATRPMGSTTHVILRSEQRLRSKAIHHPVHSM